MFRIVVIIVLGRCLLFGYLDALATSCYRVGAQSCSRFGSPHVLGVELFPPEGSIKPHGM